MIPRLMPALTLIDGQINRTQKFSSPKYVGDPINAVRIFNEKGADELIIFDIGENKQIQDPSRFKEMGNITAQAFMPTAYGGGVKCVDDIYRVFDTGFDKVILGKSSISKSGDLNLISEAAKVFGTQSISFSLDFIKHRLFGPQVRGCKTQIFGDMDVCGFSEKLVEAGVGELIVRDVNYDGGNAGANLELISSIASKITIPVVAAGGIYTLSQVKEALEAGAHSVAAGNMFVYQGKRKAVLINYPNREQLDELFGVR